MRVLSIILIMVILFSCRTEQTRYLQLNTVSLAQPRVSASNNLIDSFVTITASLKLDGTTIFYSDNGQEPTLSSAKYNHPIETTAAGIYKFKAFHKDWLPSETTELALYKKGITIDSILWHTKPNAKYLGQGHEALINQNMASLNYSDTQWVGFDTIASATIFLEAKTYINNFTISYLNDMASWIFPPESITVLVDGNPIPEFMMKADQLKEMSSRKLEVISIPIKSEATTLTIEVKNVHAIPNWHDGHGQKAWLFMDEWILNK